MDSFGIGLSGLGAATRRLDSAAFDIARASTQRTAQPPAADGGGGTAPAGANGPGTAAPSAPAPGIGARLPSAEDPNLPAAMVDLISASNAVMANLQTIRRSDEALEAVLRLR
ncbi:MAG: hypothetical protein RJA99_351 [Pseudomonadota bacterium]|jgi:flagellar basal body rod protein FlgC